MDESVCEELGRPLAWELAGGLPEWAPWALGCHFGILSWDCAILRGLSKWR